MLEKGVTKLGRVFRGDEEVYSLICCQRMAINSLSLSICSNIMLSNILWSAVQILSPIDLRFKNKVLGVSQTEDGISAEIETPDGTYRLQGEYLLACDGANSRLRREMGLDFEGKYFEECFLIADVEMQADFPSERWFRFTPTFHLGQSALLHKQPDNIYRIDLQLGPDADRKEKEARSRYSTD